MSTQIHRGLSWLVGELDSRDEVLDEVTALRLLREADMSPAEVAPYVEQREEAYSRRCVVRRETYELLVLTWAPSQGSVAHDHSGSLCGLKVVQGRLSEQLFEQGPDGQVRKTTATRLGAEQILVDPGVVVHALGNDSDSGELLVTVHIYSPPLPEMRRYAVTDDPPAKLFLRKPSKNTRVIVIVGGGFTGTMTLANLLRSGSQAELPLHIVMIDRQPAFGEGIAYRTNDPRHLLNVPAGRMSAWPDRPDDFLSFAQAKDPSVRSGDFLPRRAYGQYIRQTLRELAESSGDQLSAEVLHDEATCLTPTNASGWSVQTSAGRIIQADLAVITIGHRPPDDPLAGRWIGPRHRFIADPWAALVLSQIGPDEPVLLLGGGLTAVDAILTLNRSDRAAPLIVVSRRGLMPMSHSREPKPAADVSELVARWLDPATRLTIRQLLSTLRGQIASAEKAGIDWRQVIDGLRPTIPKIWERLSMSERKRFLCRVRSFWEVHRHRMSPDVADAIDCLRRKRTLESISGALVSAAADADGVDVTLAFRDGSTKRTVRVSWVINCTGPGVHNRHTTHPILRPLLEAGVLCEDELHLGLRTDSIGRAIDSSGQSFPTLLVAGTLRKSTLWESTAVPELRQQAQAIAQTALATFTNTRPTR
ncbi:MAG: FAD/NAD(P)-binding protein [Methylacidiphilales bacterium]|jgi:uncharacterized NAD(P)/FAD-binding protein YdhS|nr:FAD/NAD(P)-binding protein [Candidatus Methylacidiphilales bacterium]